ncbi:gp49-like protein,phage replisome organizer, putative, N-terminal region,N-terminal phage replisome organiser (Phage_rep_org_N) [[Clostridium] sordellii]|uniref:phage replisome organizer N-terminal domain-containing protein n=1 Tax=Paraclostridium sordellii TaxID=1505 RepID=UPI000543AAB3|nr:phage replisome organizer N-terminal domain-containing protein [Paeniclostridium sordellii]CEK35431.1 gp49-like protein,phage replisome organizer, putative, N-terminal region,N-terminal phage replisome organiser (Phage_rep_org_N) [[Clostridium] sordellii] [Paeniclostridium sordellii]
MAKKTKRYYWIKLKADFFRQKEIKKLRRIAGGDTYTIIYLKMLLLALKNDNKLYFEGVEEEFADELALDLDEESDNVKMTLAFLQNQNLIEMINEDEYLLPQCESMTGSESESAERVRKHRAKEKEQKALHCNVSVTGSNKNVTTEKEKRDKSLDIDKENINNSSCIKEGLEAVLNYYKREIVNRYVLTSIEEDFFLKIGDKIQYDLVIKAMEISIEANVKKLSYIKGIIKKWLDSNITTLEELEAHKLQQKNKNQCKNSISQNNNNITKLPTRYHNINQSFSKYDGDELEKMLLESQKGKFK